MITVEYLPSHLNVIADWELKYFVDRSQWKLSPQVFQLICKKMGTPDIPYSEKFWRGFNLAQDENDIFAADLIWRRTNFF